MSATNPLRQVYSAFWSMLEAHSGFTDLVLVGNRIKFSGTAARSPQKPEISDADLPEVRVVQTGLHPHLQRTSNGSSLVTRWAVQIASGDQRMPALMDVQWAIYRALMGWETHVQALQWESKEFVTVCRPLEVKVELTDRRANRGIRGWSDVWAGEVIMWFATADLAP